MSWKNADAVHADPRGTPETPRLMYELDVVSSTAVPLIPGLANVAPFIKLTEIDRDPEDARELPSNETATDAPGGTPENKH